MRVLRGFRLLWQFLASHPLVAAIGVFLLGCTLSLSTVQLVMTHQDEERWQHFNELADRATRQLERRITTYEFGLRGFRGFVIGAGHDRLTRAKVAEYAASRTYATEFPGALGFGFIRRVPAAGVAEFVVRERRTDWPDYTVKSFGDHRYDRWLIQYIEPYADNRAAIGLDVASHENRRQAVVRAVRQNRAMLSEPVTLIQRPNLHNRGFLMVLPIYTSGFVPGLPEDRWQQAVGLAYAPVFIDETMRDFDFRNGEFALQLSARTADGREEVFYTSSGFREPAASRLERRRPIQLNGQTWLLHYKARPAFVDSLNHFDRPFMHLLAVVFAALIGVLHYLWQVGRLRRLQTLMAEARLGAIVRNAGDAMISTGLTGTVTTWNHMAECFLGRPAEQAVGRPVQSLLAPSLPPARTHELLTRLIAGESVPHFLIEAVDGTGTLRHLGVTASPIADTQGRVLGAAMLLRDLSEQVIAERQVQELNSTLENQVRLRTAELEGVLRENQILLRTIHQQMLYSVTDVAGRILEVNDNFCALSGYSREELLGQNHRKINSGVHPPAFWREVWAEISAGRPWHGEICNRTRNGELYWVDSVIAPFIGRDGKIERYVSLRTNITGRKQAEARVHEVSELLQNVLASASEVAIITTDCDGLITLFNAGAENMLQYRAEEMIGRCTPSVLHCPKEMSERSRALSAELNEPIAGFRVFVRVPELRGMESREWTYVRKDGGRIRVSLVVTVMRDEQGRIIGYLGVAQDITVRVRYEHALIEAKTSAEAANLSKSEFLANMSHEIRTPMNGILGLCYLLEHQPLPEDSLTMVRQVHTATQNLLGIINDILDFSKIEARRLELERVPFSMTGLVDQLRDLFTASLQGRPVTLDIGPVPSAVQELVGDSLRLSQILTNLLSNAVKFTREGMVSLHISPLARAEDVRQWVRFTVTDTGIGIPDEKRAEIFFAFSQADNSISRSFGGTGLGLAICHRLVALMDGEIRVDSEVGTGSTFTVDIPFERPDTLLPGARQAPALPLSSDGRQRLAGLHILLVDDSELNRDVACRILDMEGARTTAVGDGQAAVDMLRRSAASIDLVLMDVQMPVMDGYTATRRIRDELHLSTLPVLALTAGAMPGQRDKALQAGMSGYVTKPFQVDQLVREILACVVDRQVDATAADPELDAVMATFRQRFLNERLPLQLATLRSCLAADATTDSDTLRRTLHSLAGEAGMVGLDAIGRQARELEYQLDVSESEVRQALPALIAALIAIQEAP